MAKHLWRIEGDKVLRGNQTIATITEVSPGIWRWDGLGTYQTNFKDKNAILEHVKYFHRYPQKTRTTITFRSGRKIVL